MSGNKRTEEQSFDQVLTRTNLALARNCDCEVDELKGGEVILLTNTVTGTSVSWMRVFPWSEYIKSSLK